jgi:hypothetical protein
MRGRVCLLYMLLALTRVVFLGFESLGTRDHILLPQIWDFLFVASNGSLGHGGGIQHRLYTGAPLSQSHIATDAQLISKSLCRAPCAAYDQIFIVWQLRSCFCGTPLWREDGSVFYICCCLSRVRVPWDSWPYFTISDFRLPFSSLPTTRRVTVEVFEPASTRVMCSSKNRAEQKLTAGN